MYAQSITSSNYGNISLTRALVSYSTKLKKISLRNRSHFEKARFVTITLSKITAPIFFAPQFSSFFPWAGHFAGRYMDAADRHVVGGVPVDRVVFSVGPGTFLRSDSLAHFITASRRIG